MVFAFGLGCDGLSLFEGRIQIITDKAAQLMQFDMLIAFHRHEILCKLGSVAAFFGFQDHGLPPSLRAAISALRMSWTARQASFSSLSVSGVTGNAPILTALAS